MDHLTNQERNEAMCLTAKSGALAKLRLLSVGPGGPQEVGAAGCGVSKGVFAAAAGAGQLQLCQLLLELGCPWDKEGSAVAARGSHGMTLPRHGQTQHQAKQRWGAMRSWSAGSSQTGRKLRTAHRWTESVY
jgi:hypothetical protein